MSWSSILSILPQFGPTGLVMAILGGVIFYILYKTIPDIQQDAREQREAFEKAVSQSLNINRKQAEDFHLALQTMQAEFGKHQQGFMDALSKERYSHNSADQATVSALNLLREEIKLQTQALTTAFREH